MCCATPADRWPRPLSARELRPSYLVVFVWRTFANFPRWHATHYASRRNIRHNGGAGSNDTIVTHFNRPQQRRRGPNAHPRTNVRSPPPARLSQRHSVHDRDLLPDNSVGMNDDWSKMPKVGAWPDYTPRVHLDATVDPYDRVQHPQDPIDGLGDQGAARSLQMPGESVEKEAKKGGMGIQRRRHRDPQGFPCTVIARQIPPDCVDQSKLLRIAHFLNIHSRTNNLGKTHASYAYRLRSRRGSESILCIHSRPSVRKILGARDFSPARKSIVAPTHSAAATGNRS